jgi:hypothetical protein
MTADQFRRTALALPGVVEAAHMNHPDFRVKGKIFASLGVPDESWGMVKLTPEQQRSFIERGPSVFKPCSGSWGRRGCTNVYLPSLETNVLSTALNTAFKNLASPSPSKGAAVASKSQPKSSRKRLNKTAAARDRKRLK